MSAEPYCALYPVGSEVQVADRSSLDVFLRTWRFHNPIQVAQLSYAGRVARVIGVGFYHGGDPLYELEHIPGVWHEACLRGLSVELQKR